MRHLFPTCAYCRELAHAQVDGVWLCPEHHSLARASGWTSLAIFAVVAALGLGLAASGLLTDKPVLAWGGICIAGMGGVLCVLAGRSLWNR